VLIVVENLPVPLDRRVWLEATTLMPAHGYRRRGQRDLPHRQGLGPAPYEEIEGVHIYRYPEPPEAHSGALAYGREWGGALWHMFRLARRVRRERGFDVIHGCNPPDLIWLLGLRYRPRACATCSITTTSARSCSRRSSAAGLLHRIMLIWERLTFATPASRSPPTRASADRADPGRMAPEDVFVVRSAPGSKVHPRPGRPGRARGGGDVLGYVGVIGQQEGMDLLVAAIEHLVRRMGHST
jgi:hypothetical protein